MIDNVNVSLAFWGLLIKYHILYEQGVRKNNKKKTSE